MRAGVTSRCQVGPGCCARGLNLPLPAKRRQNSTTLKLQPFPGRPQRWAGRGGWKVQTILDRELPFHANTAIGLSHCSLGQRQR